MPDNRSNRFAWNQPNTDQNRNVNSMSLSKALRTAQNYVPGGRDRREAFMRVLRRMSGKPHEVDFEALRLFPRGRLFLDVGANYGQSAASMRLMQQDAQIICYEPNTELAAKLSNQFGFDPRIKIEPFGLSNGPGLFDLFIPYYRNFSYPGLASLNEEEARSWLSSDTLYFFDQSDVRIERRQCRIATLDSQGLEPYFIKIDVQGLEFEMLQGSIDTLSRHEPVLLIESPGRNPRIATFLSALGYHEYEFSDRHFVQCRSTGTNAFFMTTRRRAELQAAAPGLFV